MATKSGKSKQKKMAARVDFTPMVDMMMLLITFFMLCTTLSKPQTMEISLPSNDKNITDQDRSQVKASEAITILLDGHDKVYYYEGQPKMSDPNFLTPTNYKSTGIRAELTKKNRPAMIKKLELDQKKLARKVTQDQYDQELSRIKGAKGTPTVIIKATNDASYKNLVDALDEMQICSVGKYVVTGITADDLTLIKNYKNAHGGK
jgi:biopolymer transport protein ExbD